MAFGVCTGTGCQNTTLTITSRCLNFCGWHEKNVYHKVGGWVGGSAVLWIWFWIQCLCITNVLELMAWTPDDTKDPVVIWCQKVPGVSLSVMLLYSLCSVRKAQSLELLLFRRKKKQRKERHILRKEIGLFLFFIIKFCLMLRQLVFHECNNSVLSGLLVQILPFLPLL